LVKFSKEPVEFQVLGMRVCSKLIRKFILEKWDNVDEIPGFYNQIRKKK
jgi:hypothetical protein